eukprot:Gb_29834 [translate_table: standard]
MAGFRTWRCCSQTSFCISIAFRLLSLSVASFCSVSLRLFSSIANDSRSDTINSTCNLQCSLIAGQCG